jgi:predicted alpha/beta superfamily hydrolase
MPEMIVVSITNSDRVRDLTPSHSIYDYFGKIDTTANSWIKTSGGNENFFQFIREEIMPYIESHYRTQPFKIFAGHSFGGITTINCLLAHPDMFNAYIAISPSFWWDREYLLKFADRKFVKGSTLNKILFCSDGNEGVVDKSKFHDNLLRFNSMVTQKQIKGLDYQYIYYPKETHMTEPIHAYYDAIRFVYKTWDFQLEDKLVSASTLTKHYKQLSEKYGYAILPSEGNIEGWASYLASKPETLKNAIGLLEMNAQNYPSSSKSLVSLADGYVKMRDKQKAKTTYQKALSLTPKAEEVIAKLKKLD